MQGRQDISHAAKWKALDYGGCCQVTADLEVEVHIFLRALTDSKLERGKVASQVEKSKINLNTLLCGVAVQIKDNAFMTFLIRSRYVKLKRKRKEENEE